MLVLTYIRSLPNMNKVVLKHLKILSKNKPFIDKNLKELIGSDKIDHNKVKKQTSIMKKGKCFPCVVNNRTLCCKYAISFISRSVSVKKCKYLKKGTIF